MSLSKPYYRIARPKATIPDYVKDPRYAPERLQLSRAYLNIEKDLRKIFDYIEPDESNLRTFSFELYSLLLRACTEVELNCKLIMEANGAHHTGPFYTMADYKKLEQSSKLSKYKAIFPNWRMRNSSNSTIYYAPKEFIPFANFDISISKSPQWYDDYNAVKHNRETNLEKANLENCMNAVAGILVLLYSQFGASCIEAYGTNGITFGNFDDYDNDFDADVIFDISHPQISDWNDNELYDFYWNTLKNDPNPFERFTFA